MENAELVETVQFSEKRSPWIAPVLLVVEINDLTEAAFNTVNPDGGQAFT